MKFRPNARLDLSQIIDMRMPGNMPTRLSQGDILYSPGAFNRGHGGAPAPPPPIYQLTHTRYHPHQGVGNIPLPDLKDPWGLGKASQHAPILMPHPPEQRPVYTSPHVRAMAQWLNHHHGR